MISLIKNSSIFKNLIDKEADALYEAKLKKEQERHKENFISIANESIGEPIIIIPDSDLTISVAIISDYIDYEKSNSFIPIVEDYISQEIKICYAAYVSYNEHNLKAIMKLTPDERGALFYPCNYRGEESYKAPKRGKKALSYDEIVQVIHSTDFLKQAREYWDKYPFP